MPLYTLVEVHHWKMSNANKQNIFRNKFHNFWDVIYFHLGLSLALFYCLSFTNCQVNDCEKKEKKTVTLD